MNDDRLSGAKTRQARLGRPVLWILGISLVLALAYVIGVLLWAETSLETSAPDRSVVGSGAGEAQNPPSRSPY